MPRSDSAERVVTTWIQREAQPPARFAALVRRYRDLDYWVHISQDPQPLIEEQQSIFNLLVTSVEQPTITLPQAQSANTVDPDKQLRRIERKLPLQEKWNRAIAQWRAGNA